MNVDTWLTCSSHQWWRKNSFRLVSLMTLLRFNADAFCRASYLIGQCFVCLDLKHADQGKGAAAAIGEALDELQKELEKMELPFTRRQLIYIRDYIASDRISTQGLRENFRELVIRMQDELETELFLSLPSSKATYYEQQSPLFGAEVTAKFPTLTEDISEAGKCFALGRYTASVFHLMRIMEIAVQLLGNTLKVEKVQEKDWQKILNAMNKPIKEKAESKDPLAPAYAAAAAHLYNVKVAWRNETMHPKATYTEEEAEDILRNVRTFIAHLVSLIQ